MGVRIVVISTLFVASASAAGAGPRFERDILPIFSANCFNCHNAGSRVGLDLRTAESTLRGSHQGQVVVKGDPEKSRLYLKVSSRDMPPPAFKLKLTDAEIQTIRDWIAAGAVYDEPARNGVDAETAARFDQRLKPLLESRCISCHGGGKSAAGLDLRTLGGVLHGSANGPVIVEGSADKSPLFRKISSGSMPPKGTTRPLNEADIKLVGEWIDGARFGSGGRATGLRESFSEAEAPKITGKDREHWAFQRPVQQPIPRVKHTGSVVNAIDAFVVSKLELKGLSLSGAASKAQLVR